MLQMPGTSPTRYCWAQTGADCCASGPKCSTSHNVCGTCSKGEFHAHHHGFRKSGKFINIRLAPFMDCNVPKYTWETDSKVPLFRLPTLHIENVRIGHLNAKYQRFAGAGGHHASGHPLGCMCPPRWADLLTQLLRSLANSFTGKVTPW